jgi:hypothetical protein
MIDTDKYTGHTRGPWDTLVCSTTGKKWVIDGPEDSAWESIALIDRVGEDDVGWKNMTLIADAPLLLAEVKRLRKTIEDIEATAQDYDHPEVEEIISICMSVMERDSVGYNGDIPWNNVHSGDD